jgi:uncharacterized lipoprotein YmbA
MRVLAEHRVLLLVAIVTLAIPLGCLSKSYPEKQRHVIAVQLPAEVESSGHGTLAIGRMRVSSLFERKGFVYQTGDTTFEDDFYNEFFAPPGTLVRKATLEWLSRSSVFASVIDARHQPEADWRLEAQVQKLYGDLRDRKVPQAILEIEFALLEASRTKFEIAFRRTYSAAVNASSPSAAAIVAAWTDSLEQILTALEEDLRRVTSR